MHCDSALHTGWNETRTLCSTGELVPLQPSGGGTGKLRYQSEPCGGFLKKQLLKPDRGRRIHIEVPMLRILIYLHPAAQSNGSHERNRE